MDVVIVVTIIILLIALITFIIACLLNWDNRQYDITCPEGQCPTSLLTGEKDCGRSAYNPSLEVCSLRDSCSSNLLSEAVTADLGTDSSGICEVLANGQSTACRCVRDTYCPRYTVMTFSQDSLGNIQQNVNLQNESDGNCSIPVESFFGVGGFCTATDWSSEDTKRADILRCVQGNPCAQGQAAYIADPNLFRSSDYSYYPVACVPGITGRDSFGNEIDENSVPVWDDQWGGVVQVRV